MMTSVRDLSVLRFLRPSDGTSHGAGLPSERKVGVAYHNPPRANRQI